MSNSNFKITVAPNGPYLVSGGVPLARQHIVTDSEGESLDWRERDQFPDSAQYALCRCGHSAKKPYCDGTHRKIDFDGTETASREPYASLAQVTEGPSLTLSDAESLCAFGRFCDPHGQVWNLVTQEGDQARAWTIEEAGHCPAGRLVVRDKQTGEAIEPNLEPSIGLVEDGAQKCSGPIWVRGGIPVTAADGTQYEVRNRMTLCRCGASRNKPFCDGAHAAIHFHDSK